VLDADADSALVGRALLHSTEILTRKQAETDRATKVERQRSQQHAMPSLPLVERRVVCVNLSGPLVENRSPGI
jgi:predicted HD phosphohydrolase